MTTWLDHSAERNYGIHDRLLNRELGDRSRHSRVRGLYGDRTWIHDLDIVNELSGHVGCVNTLSWSKSGRLLASGSDDHHINIHSYQPDNSTAPFVLTTSVSTGHTANIFSVKFMPHSNDRTIVSCAGDRQVRIFDLEYAGQTVTPSASSNLASASRAQRLLGQGVNCLTDGNTNARVYRSHGDRVKRIVTESSPHLFLSCSEDGEVRQWDLRLPSSAYPPPTGGRGFRNSAADDDDGVPPPLISYKRYRLDLNTISCSPSQPHYIALGGAHQHCFLHDRRMLGRDRNSEKAGSISPAAMSEHEDSLLGEATQCVRRFGPGGKKGTKGHENGHITACKISDANPNEMVASWSGDWIYSFDLARSSDAMDKHEVNSAGIENQQKQNRLKQSKDRKRKRTKADSTISQEGAARATSKPRRKQTDGSHEPEQMALRVSYENGQSESIPLRNTEGGVDFPVIPRLEADRVSHRIAQASVKIRKHIFSLGPAKPPTQTDPLGHGASFSAALGIAASILSDMDDISSGWRYPMDPSEVDVAFQDTLRRNRESARRFVQASGTISRLLNGRLQTAGSGNHPQLEKFAQISPAPNEKPIVNTSEQFCYDFLKAIVVWLDSGPGALLEAFTPHRPQQRSNPRYPIPENATIEALDDILIPYLLGLAGEREILNLAASRFEVDSNRRVFETERAAVLAFANAVKIPFVDLSRAVVPATSSNTDISAANNIMEQDRKVALRFWGLKVCRGILLHAGEGVNYSFVMNAFGGLGRGVSADIIEDERSLAQELENIDPDDEEPSISRVRLGQDSIPSDIREVNSTVSSGNVATEQVDETGVASATVPVIEITDEDAEGDEDEIMIAIDDVAAAIRERYGIEGDDEDEDVEGQSDALSHAEESADEDDAAEDGDGTNASYLLFQSVFSRSVARRSVQSIVPISTHTRSYRGHCNVKTVKDVNFFGLNDEYVVSGSDDHHLFIWDKRTSQLVNILEGDGEVVNVVQGHPYEPMLAVSGIDHTIKIFSPDAQARRNAAKGIGVCAADETGWSSIQINTTWFGGRRPRRQPGTGSAPIITSEPTVSSDGHDGDSDVEFIAPNGLTSRKRMHKEYEITSQNDVDRRGGNQDAWITRSMLEQLAHRLHMQRNAAMAASGGAGEDEDGERDDDGEEDALLGEGPTVLTDECNVM